MKREWSLVCTAGCLILLGCEEGAVSLHYHDERPPPPPPTVIVEHGHVCSHGCAHYWDGGHYVVVKHGHRHGPGCGHYLAEGRWVVGVAGPHGTAIVSHGGHHSPPPARVLRIPPPPGPSTHYVYSRSGSKWQKVRVGHRHGPGCGHIVVEGHWCID